jgi:hypothetical protein
MPEEKEADAVSEKVADKLHGGAGNEKKTKEGGEAGAVDGAAKEIAKEQAPEIGAKLLDGAIMRAAKDGGDNLPLQLHHFLTNKHATYTPAFAQILKKYKLDLEGDWNKEMLPHNGRHPNEYHDMVLAAVRRADAQAKGDQAKFLQLIEQFVKAPVRKNPKLLRKEGWP